MNCPNLKDGINTCSKMSKTKTCPFKKELGHIDRHTFLETHMGIVNMLSLMPSKLN